VKILISGGGASNFFFEEAGKIMREREADLLCNFGDWEVSFLQEFASVF
jgi:hypothetical protein